MKTATVVLAFFAVLSVTTMAKADTTATWKPNPSTIEYIEPAVGGHAWIKLVGESAAIANVCGTPNVLLATTRGTEEGRRRAYKTLMAAFLAGKHVWFKLVSPTDASGFCEIDRFRILD